MAKFNYTATNDNGKAFRTAFIGLTNAKASNIMKQSIVTSSVSAFLAENKDFITDDEKARHTLTVNAEGKKRFPINKDNERRFMETLKGFLPMGEVTAHEETHYIDGEEVETVVPRFSDGLYSGYVAVYMGEGVTRFNKGVDALIGSLFKGEGDTTDFKRYLLASIGYKQGNAVKVRTGISEIAQVMSEKAFADKIIIAIGDYLNRHGLDCVDRTTEAKLRTSAKASIKYDLTADNFKRILKEEGLYKTVTATAKTA